MCSFSTSFLYSLHILPFSAMCEPSYVLYSNSIKLPKFCVQTTIVPHCGTGSTQLRPPGPISGHPSTFNLIIFCLAQLQE
jgi:hypothetical protein